MRSCPTSRCSRPRIIRIAPSSWARRSRFASWIASTIFGGNLSLPYSRCSSRCWSSACAASRLSMILSLRSTVNRHSLPLVFHLLPPLTPPAGADQDPQLGVPAVREVIFAAEIVHAVVASLIAVRLALQHRVLG